MMWNIVRYKVRASQMKVGQDEFANVWMFAPDASSNAGKSKCRVVIGRDLLLALFLLVTTNHRQTTLTKSYNRITTIHPNNFGCRLRLSVS